MHVQEASGSTALITHSPSWHLRQHTLLPDRRLIEGPWWGRCLGRQPGAWWLAHIDAAALNAEPLRKRIGYLNTLEDLLKHLGHRMQARGLCCFMTSSQGLVNCGRAHRVTGAWGYVRGALPCG